MPEIYSDFVQRTHGHKPFPWQQRLAESVAAGAWPDALNLPTSSGKTAVVDVWLWAHSVGIPRTPRRLYYVIDRRTLVDAVAEHAQGMISRADLDARVVRLRGGTGASDEGWMLDPSKPVLISTTVDQIGSRLLCRAYGVGRFSAPIHAGLAGNDALIVIDEAHLVEPFRQTLSRIALLRQVGTRSFQLPWHILTMTATPVSGEAATISLDEADRKHPVLSRRLQASKLGRLVRGNHQKMAVEAQRLRNEGAAVVGVVVNTVDGARQIHADLASHGEAMLVIGRARPYERDQLGVALMQRAGTGTRSNSRMPLYVVATQTIEVGMDLDFDGLVTELAPLSAMRQRLGRLDRLGELGQSHAVVVRTPEKKWPYDKDALDTAWQWLETHQQKRPKLGKVVELGIQAQVDMPAESGGDAPVLTSVDVDLLFDSAIEVDVSSFLHGERRSLEVFVAWRTALDELPVEEWVDAIEDSPPQGLELMPVPRYAVTKWLSGVLVDTADFDGLPEASNEMPDRELRQAVRWNGEFAEIVAPRTLRSGDVIIVPARYGGADRFGWNPASSDPVRDLYAEGLVLRPRWAGNNARTQTAIALGEHLEGVGRKGKKIASSCGLDALTAHAVADAARLHDIGKNDPRFQLMLGASTGRLLAKSGAHEVGVSRQLAGLPMGWRHEIASLALRPDLDPLVRYLVGSHHGRGRPWLPATPDMDLWTKANGSEWPALVEIMRLRYGCWGLAYLEALVRLADWCRSAEEQSVEVHDHVA